MSKLISAVVLAAASAVSQAEVLSTDSHLAGLQIRLRHTPPSASASGHALPVLFIHGASFPSALAFDFRMDGQSWMDKLAARGFDVYALDFPGYGLSDRYPGAAQAQGRARDVVIDVDRAVDLVLAKTGKPQLALIAHSWGGSVGALYAEKHPAKIGKLVLFAAVTERKESTPREAAEPFEELTPEQRIASMDGLRPANEAPLLHPDVFKRWGAEWLASDRAGVHGGVGKVRFPSGPSADVDDLRHGQGYYDPSRITAPVLLVRGEWDKWPNDADFKGLMAKLTRAQSKEYVIIPRGTHVMHLESAHEQLQAAVERFLTN